MLDRERPGDVPAQLTDPMRLLDLPLSRLEPEIPKCLTPLTHPLRQFGRRERTQLSHDCH